MTKLTRFVTKKVVPLQRKEHLNIYTYMEDAAPTSQVFQPLLLDMIYHVGLTILRRIADYFVQNRRFFLHISKIFRTFAAAKVL